MKSVNFGLLGQILSWYWCPRSPHEEHLLGTDMGDFLRCSCGDRDLLDRLELEPGLDLRPGERGPLPVCERLQVLVSDWGVRGSLGTVLAGVVQDTTSVSEAGGAFCWKNNIRTNLLQVCQTCRALTRRVF